MRRVACIALPQIRVEIAREAMAGVDSSSPTSRPPLAIVIARPGGSVKTERDVLGNTRLDVVSREARTRGVRAGQTVAGARAKCAELRVRVVAEGAVRSALERVAEVALAFGPSASFDAATDVVWIEVGGCAHLHGGEHELGASLAARIRELGHTCRVSVADGPRIAAAVARFARVSRRDRESDGPTVVLVPVGQGAAAVRALPLEALALDDDTVVWLQDLGLASCAELQKLPRASLGTRLGARAKDVMQLLGGDDFAPLVAWRPPEIPEERAELEWGAASVEALVFVVKALCDRLAARLEGRAMAASRLVILFGLDRALLADGAPHTAIIDLALPVPIARARDLFAVLQARLEHFEIASPALAVTVRALELAPAKAQALDWLAPEPKAERALSSLVAELAADLGPASIGLLALVDTWVPDERTRLVPFGVARASTPLTAHAAAALVSSGLEPSRLVQPERVTMTSFPGEGSLELIARFESVQWWRRGIERRDVCAAWNGEALAWIAIHGGEGYLRGWID